MSSLCLLIVMGALLSQHVLAYPLPKANLSLTALYQVWFKGDGTYYGLHGDRKGICTLEPTPDVGNNDRISAYVAINSEQFNHSFTCGMCFRVIASGNGLGLDPITGDFIVYVKDLCPECRTGDLDFARDGDGRWDLHMQAVQCPVDRKNATLEYKFQGSHKWYMKMQTRNERVPVTALHMWQHKSQRWLPLKKTMDGFWEMDTRFEWERPLVPPFRVRLTSHVTGITILDSVSRFDCPHRQLSVSCHRDYGYYDNPVNDEVIPGTGQQFPLDHNIPTA